ncbi:MAG: hypothetical protein Q8934_01685 [Bacillota bacterium]|nr:hypothetical protein [Bacillota bacterium]
MIPFNQYYTTFFMPENLLRSPYPKVDTKILKSSVKSFRDLMRQGDVLLDHLEDSIFAYKIMDAAQKGNRHQVESLVKSIGLKVPFTVQYNPTSVIFTLYSKATPYTPDSCCNLTISMRWGE